MSVPIQQRKRRVPKPIVSEAPAPARPTPKKATPPKRVPPKRVPPKPGVTVKVVPSEVRAVPPIQLPRYDRPIKEVINQRRRQLIVHSVLYYRMNTNIVSDHDFDRWCKELVDLQMMYPKESSEVPFAEEFKDFDGSTGFHLASIPWGQEKAQQLLNYHKGRVKA